MHQLQGCGLQNVNLMNGYVIDPEDQAVAYADLKGLYKAIALAVACRGANLTASEFHFLRRRLDKSQAEVGALLGLTDQAVAKWEKGKSPVPVACAAMLRMAWLRLHAPECMARVVDKMWSPEGYICHGYVFAYEGSRWVDQSHAAELKPLKAQAERETVDVITTARIRASAASYTLSIGASVATRKVNA